MTRRMVWSALLLVAAVVLLGSWFVAKFEQVPAERWTPPAGEARRNPYLALERFLNDMGRPLQRATDATRLDRLPAGGVLILDSHRRAHLSPARTARLMDWVAAGGYLIVAAEAPGIADPVLEFFEVNCCGPAAQPTASGKARNQPFPRSLTVAIPGAPRALQTDFIPGRLSPGQTPPDWQAGAPNQPAQMLHFHLGSGQVTLLSSLAALADNQHIGHLDHAELLWTLLATYQPERRRPVILLSRLASPTLADWLLDSAWTAAFSLAVLIALWLWSVVPRFGQARPPVPPARRELREHLAAIGRYVWRVGGLAFWLDTARAACRNRLALRHPGLVDLPPADQALALAKLSGHPAELIAAALHRDAQSPQSFTLALRTLRHLERTL